MFSIPKIVGIPEDYLKETIFHQIYFVYRTLSSIKKMGEAFVIKHFIKACFSNYMFLIENHRR